jgi:hypothetical protein
MAVRVLTQLSQTAEDFNERHVRRVIRQAFKHSPAEKTQFEKT